MVGDETGKGWIRWDRWCFLGGEGTDWVGCGGRDEWRTELSAAGILLGVQEVGFVWRMGRIEDGIFSPAGIFWGGFFFVGTALNVCVCGWRVNDNLVFGGLRNSMYCKKNAVRISW